MDPLGLRLKDQMMNHKILAGCIPHPLAISVRHATSCTFETVPDPEVQASPQNPAAPKSPDEVQFTYFRPQGSYYSSFLRRVYNTTTGTIFGKASILKYCKGLNTYLHMMAHILYIAVVSDTSSMLQNDIGDY